MDLGLLGFFKKLITSQINWLTVWLKLQLQAGAESFAESFPLSNPSGDRPGSCARGGAERLTAQRALSYPHSSSPSPSAAPSTQCPLSHLPKRLLQPPPACGELDLSPASLVHETYGPRDQPLDTRVSCS